MSVLIAALSLGFLIVSACLGVLVREVRKQATQEATLNSLVKSVDKLVIDKDKTHMAMLEQMKIDRDATNRRLRFLEEWFMTHRSAR